MYLGLSQGSRELQDTVEMLTRAGGRAKGKGHAPEYEFSKGGSYYTALKRGALKIQMAADRGEARSANIRAFGEARLPPGRSVASWTRSPHPCSNSTSRPSRTARSVKYCDMAQGAPQRQC